MFEDTFMFLTKPTFTPVALAPLHCLSARNLEVRSLSANSPTRPACMTTRFQRFISWGSGSQELLVRNCGFTALLGQSDRSNSRLARSLRRPIRGPAACLPSFFLTWLIEANLWWGRIVP